MKRDIRVWEAASSKHSEPRRPVQRRVAVNMAEATEMTLKGTTEKQERNHQPRIIYPARSF